MSNTEKNVFVFPASITISECDNLLEKLVVFTEQNSNVLLDASEVKKIDTAGVQLIMSFFQDGSVGNMKTESIMMSDEIKSAFGALGLQHKLASH